jgi:hypothetical protein
LLKLLLLTAVMAEAAVPGTSSSSSSYAGLGFVPISDDDLYQSFVNHLKPEFTQPLCASFPSSVSPGPSDRPGFLMALIPAIQERRE